MFATDLVKLPVRFIMQRSTKQKLLKVIRTHNALKQIDKIMGINIKKTSQINILKLYQRLKNCAGLPNHKIRLISNEKINTNDVLTPKELELFTFLLKTPLSMNHASPSAQAILESKLFCSTNELIRKNIPIKTHTPNRYGERNFIFFSYEYQFKKNANIVRFLDGCDTFVMDFDTLAKKEPILFKGCWTSGHFYAYDHLQTSEPIIYHYKNLTDKVNLHYKVSFLPVPLHQKQFKFQNNTDEKPIFQLINREDEIACGRHIKPYHALRLIEHLRFLSADLRCHVLENSNDLSIVSSLFSSLFTPGKAELHIPVSLEYDATFMRLERGYTKTATAKKSIQDAIKDKNFDLIKSLSHPSLETKNCLQISYADSVRDIDLWTAIADYFAEEVFIDLLNHSQGDEPALNHALMLASFYNNSIAIKRLIEHGANPNNTFRIEQTDENEHLVPICMKGTPFSVAASKGLVNAVSTLIQCKADVNGIIRCAGSYNEYGKGNSVLLEALIRTKKKSAFEYHDDHIPHARYNHLPKSSAKDYQLVIEMLIQAGADLNYCSGSNKSVKQHLKEYIETQSLLMHPFFSDLYSTFNLSELSLRDENSITYAFNHYGYAAITAKRHDDLFLLIASHSEFPNWVIPGGLANYLLDHNLRDTAIHLSGYQTGINLAEIEQKTSLSFSGNIHKKKVEVHHFTLPTIFSLHPTTKTLCFRHPHDRFNNETLNCIQWVNLKNISVKSIHFEEHLFPIFLYQDKCLPFILTPLLNRWLGLNFDPEIIGNISVKLGLDSSNLLDHLIFQGSSHFINVLLPICKPTNANHLLETALKYRQYESVNVLLQHHILFEKDAFDSFFSRYGDSFIHAHIPPIRLQHLLFDLHHNLLNEYSFDTIAYYAGTHNAEGFIERLLNQHYHQSIHSLIKGALTTLNIKSLQKLKNFSIHSNQQHSFETAFGNSYKMHDPRYPLATADEVKRFFELIHWIINNFDTLDINKMILLELCEKIDDFSKDPLQTNSIYDCFHILEKLTDRIRACHEEFYGYELTTINRLHRRFNRKNKKNNSSHHERDRLGSNLTYLFRHFESITFSIACDENDTKVVDYFLNQYCNYSFIQNYLKYFSSSDIHSKDPNGNTCLQRAVKSNSFPVVELLLKSCSEEKGSFDINREDNDEKTPLDNALLSNHRKIALLLTAYGAKTKFYNNSKQKADFQHKLAVKYFSIWKKKCVKNKDNLIHDQQDLHLLKIRN